MKGSDFIAQYFSKIGVNQAFVLTGGCIIHFIDSLSKAEGIDYLPMLHEQSCAMAADAYARVTGNLGVAATTSGPGATNLLTGLCCSYYDSIPVVHITGQVHSSKLKRDLKTRQYGFQETDVVSIFKSVTKYCTQVNKPEMLEYELLKAVDIATTGRKGPVLLDITEDVLYSEFVPMPTKFKCSEPAKSAGSIDSNKVAQAHNLISNSARPVLVLGAGALNVDKTKLKDFVSNLGIPVLLTWGAFDLLSVVDDFFVGGFGVTSRRGGNFVIQKSDLILAMGTRFDTHEIGNNPADFSPLSRRIVVDIDSGEIAKYSKIGFRTDITFVADCEYFIDHFIALQPNKSSASILSWRNWFKQCQDWDSRYPVFNSKQKQQSELVNPYEFFDLLLEELTPQDIIITDCGSNLIWTMQSLQLPHKFKNLISAFNHSPMGYSLPASIGAALASPNSRVICISGDGGLQINIQELATVSKNQLNIKIFVLNNHSHGIIQGTQDSWLDGRHHASCPLLGKLPDPDPAFLANSYSISNINVFSRLDLTSAFSEIFKDVQPGLVNVHMQSGPQIEPKLLYGNKLENMHPLLSNDELYEQFISK
ncbi:thiamine pyrophosphate-binding protein [Synechococcus sp. PROS-U-1]|uniref:thiamine pyrophosphate-binding protein n=1 Tax=Synechococcus sp. PROS-U-1 TaxID=1400866 RepID=UPI0016461544|nr:thiamine pyrophosphate-binding protein [Synechococcus sp. PROS-U-1]QNJ01752.1 acetolactate synthase/ large subunit/ biosynthetic type [Synechococcus sp. PROS-U-1]